MAPRSRTNIMTRAAIVALKSPFGGKTTVEISVIIDVSQRIIDSIY